MEKALQSIFKDGLALGELRFVGDGDGIGADGAGLGDPQRCGVRHEYHIIVAAFLVFQVGDLGFQHTDDGVAGRADLDGLAHGVSAIGDAVDVGTHDADLFVVFEVHIVEEPPFVDGVAQYIEVDLADALDGGVGVAVGADLDGAADGAGGGDGREEVGVGLHDVVHRIHRHIAGAAVHDLNAQDVGAHIGEAVLDALGHAVAEADDDDDGHDADDDAQHGEEGAEFIAPDVLERLTDGLVYHVAASCFVKVRVGCTTASGAWASPS